MEVYSYKKAEIQKIVYNIHFGIDLLIEIPLILAVITSGIVLLTLISQITVTHIIKIAFVTIAIASGIACVFLVITRKLNAIEVVEDKFSKAILITGSIGIICALIAATLGIWLAYHRTILA
ncbi:MAG: hypothetical protein HY739_06490 [Desulfobacterales bacterium]|nr:hypothetical protein [Desulfobacterales bacterium]